MLLIGPIAAVLAGATRSAVAPSGLSQAAFSVAVGLLVVAWLTNRGVPFMPLIGAVATALVLTLGVMTLAAVAPPPADEIGPWILACVLLPGLYLIGVVVILMGFVRLIWLGPMADA